MTFACHLLTVKNDTYSHKKKYHQHLKRKAGGNLFLQKGEVSSETIENIHPASDCFKNRSYRFLTYQLLISKASKEIEEVKESRKAKPIM